MGYAAALAVTLVVEAVVYAAALPRLGPVSVRAALAASTLVNLVTHPWAWLLAWPFFRDVLGPAAGSVLLETLVCAAEWRALRRWKRFDGSLSAAVVLLANGASLGAGALVLR